MSLSISQEKIDELLKNATVPYVVTSSHISFTSPLDIVQEPLAVSGTMSQFSLFTVETKERLMDLRRKIVESQIPLKDEKEIEDEIDEMRERKAH